MQPFGHKGRLEDERMLKGRGRYVADWNLPGQAYGHFVRSDRAHAEIAAVDASSALAMPGVIAVLTGADVAAAGLRPLPAAAPVKGRGGAEQLPTHRPALAQGRVRYVGEPVALVVAESTAGAQDAAETVAVEYRELPAVIDARVALARGAPLLHENVPGNLLLDFAGGDEAATEAAFRRAARVVELTSYHSRVVGNPMEPRAGTGAYDPASDTYQLYACTQGVTGMRGQMSAVHRGEMALDASGRILGMRFEFVCNLGAYLAFTGSFVNTVNLVNVASGVYDVQAVHVQAKLTLTNTVPTAAYRGAGRPVSSYAIERLVDQAAHEIGMDPAEFRRRNLVAKNKFPYRLATGFEYDCGDVEGVLDKALKAAEWSSFEKRRAESRSRGRLRGRGIATYIEASGAGGFAPYDQVQITWDDAARITLRATSHSHGQGHETTYAQIVSGVLGVPMESIRLRTADPDMQLVGNPTGGSRSLLGVGSVMLMASQEVVRKGLALAAEELEAAPADVEFLEGKYRIKGTDREVALAALARKHPGRLDVDLKEKKVGTTFPNGCHIAEVEIEAETGIAEIVRYVACDDAGNIINHQIVEGQMQGGITQGAGHIFGEQAIYDPESGQLLNGSFMDYPMPRALLVNNLTVLDYPVPTQTNPLGAKGVGEAGVTGSMPCLMNAVLDALRQAGVTHFDMPATPQRVWRALQAAKAGDPRALAVAELSGHS